MVQFAFNAQQYQPNTGELGTVPSGIYDVQITSSEVKMTKRQDGYMLVLTMSIIAGEFVGRRVMARLNIQNTNQQAVEIAYGELSAISHVVGILNWQDTQELHGRPFKIKVEEVARQDDPTKKGNEIKGYYDYTGNPPTPSGGATSSPAAPAAPAPPPATSLPPATAPAAAPPWAGGQSGPAPAPVPAPAPAAVAAPAPAPAAPAVAAPAPPPWQTGVPAPVAGSTPPWAQQG